ncbi:hypothetical protein [Oceanobacillus neutriphilus]|uniref:Uracil DNA glycosylase superfamily protein n=1 Tax=Oceanobacillus neutriphilus TaxID=531815 RepID=A0ABQ2P2K4_9BACI|nr:hypothetical protein [Oceanobacillus neutriphilus]GGP16649.1 hypothetical protein GCM10011346_49410 [Oceanobacillus neutriphilus]
MLDQYLPYIEQLPDSRELRRDDLIHPDFLIEKENNLEIYYAPHNEYINDQAEIVIVGITPGWTQMKKAFETFVALKAANLSVGRILEVTKKEASFSGTMRLNLIHMLDEIKLHDALGLPGTACIFENSRPILHTTSMIKYPVFYKGKNYTGHQPKIKNSPLLSKYAYDGFADEINSLPPSSLLIPLGKTVDAIIDELKQEGRINQVCLKDFPHPSGANGHRMKEFNKQKNTLTEMVDSWKQNRSEM